MKIFGREPAVVLAVINALLGVGVALHLFGLTTVQGGALTTFMTALVGVITAIMVRPFAPTAVTYLFGTIVEALGTFHYHLSADVVGAGNVLIMALVGMLVRPQSTPTADPVVGGAVTKANVPEAHVATSVTPL